eukprot:gene27222-2471_t
MEGEGSEADRGGLQLREGFHKFQAPAPKTSMLGLDKLAAAKRAEAGDKDSKRFKLSHEDPDAGGGEASNPLAGASDSLAGDSDSLAGKQERRYRGQRMDTPSHPGGVNSALLAEQKDRQRDRERGAGVYHSTGGGRAQEDDSRGSSGRAGGGSSRHSDADRYRSGSESSGRERGEQDRDRGREQDRDRRDGGRSSSRGEGGSDRSGRDSYRRDSNRDRDGYERPSSVRRGRDWEPTPLRQVPSADEWEMTPIVPSGSRPSSSHRDSGRPPRSSAGSAWVSGGDTPLPEAAVPMGAMASGGGGSSRGSARAGRVEFDVAPSPALTPTWKSASWNRPQKKATGKGEEVERSPDLRPEEERRGDEDGFDETMRRELELDERQQERDWYDQEEFGGVTAEAGANPFVGDEQFFQKRAEILQKKTRKDGTTMSLMQTKRANELERDMNAWEENRLLTSGVVRLKEVSLDFDTDEDSRVILLDPTSDMAVIARKGSDLVKQVRSKIAEITGLTAEEKAETERVKAEAAANKEGAADGGDGSDGEEGGGRKAGQFKSHLKKNVAASVFSRTKTIGEQRRSLPVFTVREELMQVVRENQVIIVVGETGSGKTTQMTQYLHEEGYTKNGLVGCTQPRRVAAMSVAKRVSEEMGVELGKDYMTDGVLLRETLTSGDLDQYSVVVMDEAHERSLNTDVLFGILKKVVARRTDFRLIVTSATLDSKKFAEFFGSAPVFSIPGRTFPVETMWSRTVQEDYVEAAVKPRRDRDHLLLSHGEAGVNEVRWADYPRIAADLQSKIFDAAGEGERKVIVSTNIAETSLTVDGILYVIDTGYVKMKVFNPKMGMDSLQVFPISQAAAGQRLGRGGRTGPGVCYRLYTEGAFRHEMLATNVPEIQRTNLANVVLLLKSLKVDNLLDFGFMDPPPKDNILNSMYQLWWLGALDNTGGLTQTGKQMVEFPLEPALAKLLLSGTVLGCGNETLTIVSMLSVPSVFFRPNDRAEESDAAREKFFIPETVEEQRLQQWKNNSYRADWCDRHFLHAKGLRKAKEVRTQLADIMTQHNIVLTSCGHEWDVVRKAICSAYFQNAGKFKSVGEYVNCRTGMPCHLHPSSALYGLGYTPDYICYHELVMTSKEYMQCVTAVEPEWLAELGPMFFSIKESHTSRIEQRKKERANKESMKGEMDVALAKKQADIDAVKAKEDAIRSKQRDAIAAPEEKDARSIGAYEHLLGPELFATRRQDICKRSLAKILERQSESQGRRPTTFNT